MKKITTCGPLRCVSPVDVKPESIISTDVNPEMLRYSGQRQFASKAEDARSHSWRGWTCNPIGWPAQRLQCRIQRRFASVSRGARSDCVRRLKKQYRCTK